MIDIRIPIGLMFSIFGLLLTVYGLFTSGSVMYQKSFDINVNLFCGILMLIFGALMLWRSFAAKH